MINRIEIFNLYELAHYASLGYRVKIYDGKVYAVREIDEKEQ